MDLSEWEVEIEAAFKSQGDEYTPGLRGMIHGSAPLETNERDMQVSLLVLDTMQYYFWQKVVEGTTFGDVDRVKKKFGKTLEENYGLSSGPFLDLA